MGLRLYTFAISTFSEKVRWALDRSGVDYEEVRLLPGPHVPVIRRMAPRSYVPVLVHDGRVLQESSKILDYLSQRGIEHDFAANPEPAREKELDHAFGFGMQTLVYEKLLSDRQLTQELWLQGGPPWGQWFYALAYPLVARVVKSKYVSNDARIEQARQLFERTLAGCDAALERSAYLGGDEPSRLDLTVAALLAPLIQPKEHVLRWPEPSRMLAPWFERFAGSRTLKHARELYETRRQRARQREMPSG